MSRGLLCPKCGSECYIKHYKSSPDGFGETRTSKSVMCHDHCGYYTEAATEVEAIRLHNETCVTMERQKESKLEADNAALRELAKRAVDALVDGVDSSKQADERTATVADILYDAEKMGVV